jgi:hypothetical protein
MDKSKTVPKFIFTRQAFGVWVHFVYIAFEILELILAIS